jgi:RNA polymerase sigma factor (TIGR02999 family)
MGHDGGSNITPLLQAASNGDVAARDRVISIVYGELHERARALLAHEREGHTLSPRDLLHEAYLRLFTDEKIHWEDHNHFFAIAVRRMRQILINHAKHRNVRLRFVERIQTELQNHLQGKDQTETGVEALEEALERLERGGAKARILAQIVDMKFFGGMSQVEIAESLGVSSKTVQRDLKVALMLLLKDMAERGRGGS